MAALGHLAPRRARHPERPPLWPGSAFCPSGPDPLPRVRRHLWSLSPGAEEGSGRPRGFAAGDRRPCAESERGGNRRMLRALRQPQPASVPRDAKATVPRASQVGPTHRPQALCCLSPTQNHPVPGARRVSRTRQTPCGAPGKRDAGRSPLSPGCAGGATRLILFSCRDESESNQETRLSGGNKTRGERRKARPHPRGPAAPH